MKLEGYRIVREINRGPITTVYLAVQKNLDRPVFLKILNTHLKDQPDLTERFKREAKICARLKHPNIVQIFDFGEVNGSFFISMEYLEGKSLAKIIADYNPLPLEIIFYITREIAKGLAYAHQFGVVHRDIKPANIMVENDGSVKITDFGLATHANFPTVTMQFSAVGTPAYMAPEQALGEEVTFKSDLFGLGATIYEMCVGQSPFNGQNVAESVSKVLNFTPPALHKKREDIPQWFSDLVAKLLSKKADQRLKSAKELIENENLKQNVISQEEFAEFLKTPDKYRLKRLPKEQTVGHFQEKIGFKKWYAFIIILLGMAVWLGVRALDSINPADKEIVSKAQHKLLPIDTLRKPLFNKTVQKQILTDDMAQGKVISTKSPGSEITEKVTNNTRNRVNSKQKVVSDKVGRFFVICNPWAKVFIDGKYMETTPFSTPLNLPIGKHRVKLVNPNFASLEKDIIVRGGYIDTLKVNLKPVEMGLLKIQAVPWGEVYLDGKLIGETPLEISVKAGRYLLSIKNPKLKTYRDSINIIAGKTFERRVALKE